MWTYLRNKWIGVSDDALVEAENDLLFQAGLDMSLIRINDIRI